MSLQNTRRWLTEEERRQIARIPRTVPAKKIARHFECATETVYYHRRKAPKVETLPDAMATEIAQRFGFAGPEPIVRTLITAYEDGKQARKQWGDQAKCLYKNEHAQAWKLGFDAK